MVIERAFMFHMCVFFVIRPVFFSIKAKYRGHIFSKNGHYWGISLSQTQIVFFVFTDLSLYSNANPGFDYGTTPNYTIEIACSDSKDQRLGYFTLYIIENIVREIVPLEVLDS